MITEIAEQPLATEKANVKAIAFIYPYSGIQILW